MRWEVFYRELLLYTTSLATIVRYGLCFAAKVFHELLGRQGREK